MTVFDADNARKEFQKKLKEIHALNLNISEDEVLDEVKKIRKKIRLQ